jgi:hypothetical protein
MIDSVMDREFNKINIDRLITQDEERDEILITDESEIKKLVAHHFQNCAGSTNCNKEIPEEWFIEYKPKEDIDESLYDSIMFPITSDEIVDIAKELPSKKATGPTGIAYKDIKLTIEPLKDLLKDIFNEILKTGVLPKDWLRAQSPSRSLGNMT